MSLGRRIDLNPRRTKHGLLALLAGTACATAPPAQSEQQAEPESWFERWTGQDTMTGDWGGGRTDLADLGITFWGDYEMSYLGAYPESSASDTA